MAPVLTKKTATVQEARQILSDWMNANESFDMEAWVLRVIEFLGLPDEPGCVECARLRNDIQELTCGDPCLVCPNCRPDKQSVPACGELSVWGGTEILSCGLPAGHSGHHEFS